MTRVLMYVERRKQTLPLRAAAEYQITSLSLSGYSAITDPQEEWWYANHTFTGETDHLHKDIYTA